MILIYPHTLQKYKKQFDDINQNSSVDQLIKNNAIDQWNKIKKNTQLSSKNNKKNENTLNEKSPDTKILKDQYSQTNYVIKKDKNTHCSPIKFESKPVEEIFQNYNSNVGSSNSFNTPKRLSAAEIAKKSKRNSSSYAFLNDNFSDNSDVNKRKRHDVTIYSDDLVPSNIKKKQRDDYRVIEKDGVVYTVLGDSDEIHDNGDVHDIIEQSKMDYEEIPPIPPISARIRTKLNQCGKKYKIKWQPL